MIRCFSRSVNDRCPHLNSDMYSKRPIIIISLAVIQ